MAANFLSIDSVEELESLINESHERPVVLFKHSSTCGISSAVYSYVSGLDAKINLIVVQNARSVSNAVAERTGIRHESPQAIVLKGGKPAYHASHYDITAEDILANLSEN